MAVVLAAVGLLLWFASVVLVLRTSSARWAVLAAALFGVGALFLLGCLTYASQGSPVWQS